MDVVLGLLLIVGRGRPPAGIGPATSRLRIEWSATKLRRLRQSGICERLPCGEQSILKWFSSCLNRGLSAY